jgi:L-fuculose-phosphate aldolase
MKYESQQSMLCEFGRRIWQQGLSPGTGGNISVRVSKDKTLISPTLTSMGFMEPDDISLINFDGEVLEGRLKPSSEFKLHVHVYNTRPSINAAIHAHPPFATAFAVTGEPFSTFTQPETVVFLKKIPFVEYGTPSTNELPVNLDKYLKENLNTFLLQNHGVLCIGEDLDRTYNNLETLENSAKILVISRLLGGEKEISKNNLKKLVKLFNVDLEI